jgi:2'-5' RNA ligase
MIGVQIIVENDIILTMKDYIVVYPEALIALVLAESKKIQKEIYSQEGSEIYFRIKTKDKIDNPRRFFFKGDGRIIEAQVKPHLSLVQNIELPESETKIFFEKIEKIAKEYKPFYLEFDGVGNYGQSFTFFLRFKDNDFLTKLRGEILAESRKYLTDDEYNQHTSVNFVPHITLLYDDIDPEKVERAQKLLDIQKFKEPVLIDNIQIWEVNGSDLRPVKTIHL